MFGIDMKGFSPFLSHHLSRNLNRNRFSTRACFFHTYFHHNLLSKPCSGEKRENLRLSDEKVKLSDGLPVLQTHDQAGVAKRHFWYLYRDYPAPPKRFDGHFVPP
jgi:hypothetical protein